MAQMIVAAFDERDMADKAVTELEDAGFDSEEMSVIVRDTKEVEDTDGEGSHVAEGAAGGATTGAVVGGLAGLLIGAGVLPALGGLLIGGPIAAALGLSGVAATAVSGAVTGAAAGGLLGALTNLGLPEEKARMYSDTVQEGGVLLMVPVEAEELVEVQGLLKDCGAIDMDTVDAKA